MTRSRTDQATDAASTVAQHRSAYEQCRAELAALAPPDPSKAPTAAYKRAYKQADERTRAALAALYDALRHAATIEVTTRLDAVSSPTARRTLAEEIAEQANLEMASLRPERDQAIVSVALYGPPRNRLAADFGISYIVLRRIVSKAIGNEIDDTNPGPWPSAPEEAARAAGIPRIPDAYDQAITISQQHEAAEARRSAARAGRLAAHEAVRQAGGRVDVPAPEIPDFTEIRRKATEEIRAQFATLTVSPEQRLRRAGEAVDQADMEMDSLLPERDQAFASLAFYTTVKSPYLAAGLSRQGGMQRTLGRALGLPRGVKLPPREEQPDAARAAGIPFLEDAHTELPQIAAAYEAASARRAAAIEIRNAALRALSDDPNWDQHALAAVIGRNAAIVNRVVNSD